MVAFSAQVWYNNSVWQGRTVLLYGTITEKRGYIMAEQTNLTPTKPHPTALLLGGGGAKGAFQIGAWKALAETDLLSGIRAVAGCSVGALNAVLFALGDLEFAEKLWHEIQPSDLLALGAQGAFFSREGLIRILGQLPLERIRNSPLRIHVSVQHAGSGQPVFFELNGLSDESIRTLLLASSAIPHIYAPVRYLGAEYKDGSGTAEGDMCITPVYSQGHRDMLIVTLRHQFTVYGGQAPGILRSGASDLTTRYPDCRFTLVKPIRPMGNLITGTLNFAQEKIRQRMAQGYDDTRTALEGFSGEPKTREEYNAVITETMARLFPHADRLAAFVREYADSFAPNMQFPTLGGNVWYDNIFSVEGWRLQQQRTSGLQSHYRILDQNNVRVAWILQPEKLLQALRDFEQKHAQ